MNLPFTHPDVEQLAAHAAGVLERPRREQVARHLLQCARCRSQAAFVVKVAAASGQLAPSRAPDAVLGRVLAARERGERRILPVPPEPGHTGGRRLPAWAIAAGVALAATSVALFGRAERADAVSPHSELHLAPAVARHGETVRVRYVPAAGTFRGSDSLSLRARFRTPRDPMYVAHTPARGIATLIADGKGAYHGAFVVPDSFVYASLVVEDLAATTVDDNAGRRWEVLVRDSANHPTFASLDQRVNDMMGHSWEEGYATARRLTDLYPERVWSWTTRIFFERAVLGESRADSLSRAYAPIIDSLARKAKGARALPHQEISAIFRHYVVRARSGTDSAELRFWWDRIRREHPQHEQVAQHSAIGLSQSLFETRPRALLDSLEQLYPRFANLTATPAGTNLIYVALDASRHADDDRAFRRWYERLLRGKPDSATRLALELATRPGSRREGIASLKAVLAMPAANRSLARGGAETRARYEKRLAAEDRRVRAALGRALVADGQTTEGLSVLRGAAAGEWDLAIFRDLATAFLAAGDSASAFAMHARVTADPRTSTRLSDSLARTGRVKLGVAAWDSSVAASKREMHRALRERSLIRSLRGDAVVRDARGTSRSVRELSGGKPAVVILWSRRCGAAIEALPALAQTLPRLLASDTPVLFVVDEPASPELSEYLKSKGVVWPVHHDVDGSTKRAFASFGTPAYYVLDGAGRIRFNRVNGEAELIAMVDALRESKR